VNCEAALRQFRTPGQARHLRVDTVCTNQNNIKQRDHQGVRAHCEVYDRTVPSYLRWSMRDSMGNDLLTCLDCTSGYPASDPRCQSYAILSVLDPGIRSLVLVDYSLQPTLVITHAAIAVLVQHQSLDLLCNVTFSRIRTRRQ
jgi:hypothetical protein